MLHSGLVRAGGIFANAVFAQAPSATIVWAILALSALKRTPQPVADRKATQRFTTILVRFAWLEVRFWSAAGPARREQDG